jgi:hypothetical protein
MREGAQIMHTHGHQLLSQCAAQNPVLEEARKKLGEDGDYFESHTLQ